VTCLRGKHVYEFTECEPVDGNSGRPLTATKPVSWDARTVDPAIALGTMSSVPQPTIGVDDPDIRHWHARRVDSITEARELIGSCHQRWLQEQGPNFAIVDPDHRLLGRVVLYTDLEGGTAEIGYWVLPDARGRGVATRAARSLTRWGQDELGVRRILLEHAVDNIASCGVARSLGYALEGTARSLYLLDDGMHDVQLHAHVTGD
jgi:ribosomal-protein-alanine N-acetyltransferase